MMNIHIYLPQLFGGFLIGCSVLILMLSIGRIAGISGISSGLLEKKPQGGKLWRFLFITGLILGALILQAAFPVSLPLKQDLPIMILIFSGLLVGFGSHLGGGCTSGHGICGIGRLSKRSIIATCLFMSSGAVTVFIVRHIIGA